MGFFDKFRRKPSGKDDFAKLMLDRIRQGGEKGRLVYDAKEFRIQGESERAFAMSLVNAYQEYCAADEGSREKVVGQWVRGWFSLFKESPTDYEDAKARPAARHAIPRVLRPDQPLRRS